MSALADKLTANTLMTAISTPLYEKADEFLAQMNGSKSKEGKKAAMRGFLKFQTMALIASDRSCVKRTK